MSDAQMAEVAELKAQLALVEAENTELEADAKAAGRIESLQAEVATLKSQIDKAQAEEDTAKEALNAAEKDVERAKVERGQMQTKVAAVLDELKSMVVQKLAVSMEAEEMKDVNPFELVDNVTDIVQNREVDAQNLSRVVRELEASIALKREFIDRMENESEGAIAEKRRERAEMIKGLVFQFQEERNQLHADIAEVIRVNAEQAANLQRGHVEKRRDPDTFAAENTASTRRTAAAVRPAVGPRRTVPKQGRRATDEEVYLARQNKLVEEELQQTLVKTQEQQKFKMDVQRVIKAAKSQRARDSERQTAELRNMEAQVMSELTKVKRLEMENSRLSEQVEHLAITLKQTKNSVERIRGGAIILPTEEEETEFDDGETNGAAAPRETNGSAARTTSGGQHSSRGVSGEPRESTSDNKQADVPEQQASAAENDSSADKEDDDAEKKNENENPENENPEADAAAAPAPPAEEKKDDASETSVEFNAGGFPGQEAGRRRREERWRRELERTFDNEADRRFH